MPIHAGYDKEESLKNREENRGKRHNHYVVHKESGIKNFILYDDMVELVKGKYHIGDDFAGGKIIRFYPAGALVQMNIKRADVDKPYYYTSFYSWVDLWLKMVDKDAEIARYSFKVSRNEAY